MNRNYWPESYKNKVFTMKDKGLTHREIAEKTKVPISTVQLWIYDDRNFSKKTKQKSSTNKKVKTTRPYKKKIAKKRATK